MFLETILEPLLLVTALSADTFAACLAYGSGNIKIKFSSALVICAVCTGVLSLSMLLGGWAADFLPVGIAKRISFIILLAIGLTKLFDSSIKAFIRKKQGLFKKISFTALHMNFILQVYADPENADRDASSTLSPSEALAPALALSFDSLGAGIGAVGISVALSAVLSLAVEMAAVFAGFYIGKYLFEKSSFDSSWCGGVLLLILALLKLR